VIIEAFCSGEEYRFLVFGNDCIAVCKRIPANVTGDGKHTIRELVRKKNQNPVYYKSFLPIKIGSVEKQFLARQNLSPDSIIEANRQVFLRQNSNVSKGGDSIDFTDRVHQEFKNIAVKAVQAVDGQICGVDLVIPDITSPKEYAILEVNYNPALYLHRYPQQGAKRYVEQNLLDFLGF
jgi:glutamate--cysteine ligase